MKCIVFGDSFSFPIDLITDDDIILKPYVGGYTMKGLSKPDSLVSEDIKKTINDLNKHDCKLIFIFGQVDVHLSYYYKIFAEKVEFDIEGIVENYIKYIDSLEYDNKQKYIMGLFPPLVKDKYVIDSLIMFKVIKYSIISKFDKNFIDYHVKLSNRLKIFNKANDLMKKYCDEYDINFIDLRDDILKPNGEIKDEFVCDLQPYEFHTLWDPSLKLFTKKFKNIGIEINLDKKLDFNITYYIKDSRSKRKYNVNANVIHCKK